jgi:hypothetical protein
MAITVRWHGNCLVLTLNFSKDDDPTALVVCSRTQTPSLSIVGDFTTFSCDTTALSRRCLACCSEIWRRYKHALAWEELEWCIKPNNNYKCRANRALYKSESGIRCHVGVSILCWPVTPAVYDTLKAKHTYNNAMRYLRNTCTGRP